MADFAQMIYGTAQNTAQNFGNGLADSMAKGAQLALQKEEIQQKQLQLKQAQKQLMDTKIDKFTEALFKVQNFTDPSAKKNYLTVALPKVRDAYGLQDVFSDDVLKSLASSDENIGRAMTLTLAVARGELTATEAAGITNDPVRFATVIPTGDLLAGGEKPNITDAQKTFLNNEARKAQMSAEESRFQRGQSATQAREDRNNSIQLTNKLVEQGIPSLKSDINKLDKLVGGLDKWNGKEIPGVTGAEAKIPMNQLKGKSVQVRQAAQGVANQILKLRSGGAVSDGEASRLLKEIGMSPSLLEDGSWTTIFTGSPSSETFIAGMKGVRDKIGAIEESLRQGYGPEVYDRVMPPGKAGQPQGAGAGGGSGRSPRDLEDPKKMAVIKGAIGKNPGLLPELANAYNMSEAQLKLLLGVK